MKWLVLVLLLVSLFVPSLVLAQAIMNTAPAATVQSVAQALGNVTSMAIVVADVTKFFNVIGLMLGIAIWLISSFVGTGAVLWAARLLRS
jgi:hypothetical protein